jgi:hypothetical protein
MTRSVPKDKLDLFYNLTRTPIVPGEKISNPCTLPDGVAAQSRPMLVTAFGLEIPMPSAMSFAGFFLGWLGVGAMIAGFVLIV